MARDGHHTPAKSPDTFGGGYRIIGKIILYQSGTSTKGPVILSLAVLHGSLTQPHSHQTPRLSTESLVANVAATYDERGMLEKKNAT